MNLRLATFLYLLLVFSRSTQALNCSIQTNFHYNTYNDMTFTFAKIDPRQAISPEIKFHPDFLFCYGSVNPYTGMPFIEPSPSAADLSAERLCLPFVNTSIVVLFKTSFPHQRTATLSLPVLRIGVSCFAVQYSPIICPVIMNIFTSATIPVLRNYVHRLGCLSGVAIQSPRNFSARCRINAFKDNVVSTDELQSVEYRWAVLQETAGGWQFLESAELVNHGDIQFLVNLNSTTQPRFKCYVERVEKGDNPEENFLTRSLQEYSFSVEEAASSLTAERPHRGRCSVSVYMDPDTVKYAKYIWLAMVFDKYSHSKDLGSQVEAPAVPVTIYVLVGCGVLLLVLLAGFLYTRYKKFKNTVIIKVYRNPDYQFEMSEIHVPSGYLPMSEIRYGEGSISSDLTMSTDFSLELPVSASPSRNRFSSDCSSVDSNRPGISVQNPTEKYQPFEVEISKLSGDPGKVMLKDHGFNVFVPDELKRLRVHHKRITMHEMVGFGNFGQVHRGTLTQSTGLQTLVAVKVLKDNATFESLKDLVVEGTCMALVGAHENLVVLLAVSLRSKNPCLITEFCLYGM
ncbi:hypothetical protein EB796_008127 [Bugula neritina]|uniref:Protein kinase domain-containing protein n=1 Tax=Bugula neritina TaxID=10212 RepID=A0A7J7K6H2_BUGNE|nr:hypothetical protein EB796_008127 [Bugula neritina]